MKKFVQIIAIGFGFLGAFLVLISTEALSAEYMIGCGLIGASVVALWQSRGRDVTPGIRRHFGLPPRRPPRKC